MAGSSSHQVEPTGSQRQDDFLNLKRERDLEREGDREGSVHTSKNHSRVGSQVSQR